MGFTGIYNRKSTNSISLLTCLPVKSPGGYGVGRPPVGAVGQRHGDLDWPSDRKLSPIGQKLSADPGHRTEPHTPKA